MSEAVWRLCDQCNDVMFHDQEQSVGPNDPLALHNKTGTVTFMHTVCIRPERMDRMMPIKDWIRSRIAEGEEPWPWGRADT